GYAGQPAAHQHLGAGRAPAGDARLSGVHRSGGPNFLRTELPGFVPAHPRLCRQDSTRGEARRPSGPAAAQVPAGCQSYHRESARDRGASDAARPRRRGDRVKRREFMTLLGSAAAWPLAARAQQGERMRRIGVLMTLNESDPEVRAWAAAFQEGLQKLGWVQDRNVRIDYRWGEGDPHRLQSHAAELVRMTPDVLLAAATPALVALQRETHSLPIVFVQVSDPVRLGFVASLARPGGNITGFANFK